MAGLRHRNRNQVDISQAQLNDIQSILNEYFGTTFIAVMQDASKMTEVVDILTNNSKFRNQPTYHNHDMAVAVAREITDLGVIDQLLQTNKDITDIGFNGRFLTVETNSSKYTYGLKPGEAKITEDYIRKIVGRFALREGADGKTFSKGSPIFNGFSNNIRISATHRSLAPDGMTMSLRIS